MAKVSVKVWRPHPGPQREALSRSEDELLCGGRRGGGKTDVGLAWMEEPEYINHPMFRGLVVRQDANDLDDWLMRAAEFYRGLATVQGNPPFIRWRKGGVIRTGHWKDKSTIKKYIGKEFHKMLLEELTQGIHTLEEYKLLRSSNRSSIPELHPQIMANTNPGGPGHRWVKEYWIAIPERKVCEACSGFGCEECDQTGGIATGRIATSTNQCYTDPVSGLTRIYIPFGVDDNPSLPESYLRTLNDLPPVLRKAWRDGSWDIIEGQFFVRFGTKIRPWQIGRERAQGRIFGSLDIGISHYTSFGLWYLDSKGLIQRLFTYKANGATHRDHAMAIRDRIETFRWTDGVFPSQVWVGHDAWTRTRMREDFVVSAIDEYEDVFRGKSTRFVKANIDRENGCGQMREAFSERDGIAQVSYWGEYNKTYEDDMQAMQVCENHPETYEKVDGDDTPDEARYGIVGLRSWVANERDTMERRQQNRRETVKNVVEEEYADMMHETSLS